MNVIREINKINEKELELGTSNASWHDEYKDSAYIFVGGLHLDLTEGDVITIFSQYGEVMDINLPRSKETGKTKGFGFLMYEDQRSTVLAVDNLNGAKVLDRTLRVDHVRDYKAPKVQNQDGEWVEREEQSLNAKPEMTMGDVSSENSDSPAPDIDPEDPMAAYLMDKRKKEKMKKKKKSKDKHKDETPEERLARKERKRAKKALKVPSKSSGLRGVEQLLRNWEHEGPIKRSRSRTPSSSRSIDERENERERYVSTRNEIRQVKKESRSRSLTPIDRSGVDYRSRSRSQERNERRFETSKYDRRRPSQRGHRDYRQEGDHDSRYRNIYKDRHSPSRERK